SADWISTALSIHHFDPKPFVAEVERVLKPGGCLFTVTNTYKDYFGLTTLTDRQDINDKCEALMKEIIVFGMHEFPEKTRKRVATLKYQVPDYKDTHDFSVTAKMRYDRAEDFAGFLNSRSE
ncbi:class I SAM-dependent methyltransferase, partial [Salmonella sp. s54395]|uniref:class I SAM-dependent methyltransferase n=1 Tax=Salmonella sp. s54395 TaxID=3159664 RepID=UPI0039804E1C